MKNKKVAHNFVDLTGQKFGRLTVIERVENYNEKVTMWRCQCECGNESVVRGSHLKDGNVKSCGCLAKEISSIVHKKYNEYEVFDGIAFVKFSNCNEYFICDLDDWNKLKEYCWHKDEFGYAKTNTVNGKVSMHRLITNCPKGLVPDHLFRVSEGLCDNRKSNLEIKDVRGNILNRGRQLNNTSGKTGVGWNKSSNKWRARITVNHNTIELGSFDTYDDAVKAREQAEIKYYGKLFNH